MIENEIILGDCREILKTLPDESVNCCVTSPPYWGLRDYEVGGQIGLEKKPDDFISELVSVFKEVKRVLKNDGTLWLNLGDSYHGGGNNRGNSSPISEKQGSNKGATGQVSKVRASSRRDKKECIPVFEKDFGVKPKNLVGIPWRVALALQADGWYLRSDIIWHKPNPMPESVTDRPTKSHEYLFLMSKSETYYYDFDAIKEKANPESAQRYDYAFGGTKNKKLFDSGEVSTAVLGGRDFQEMRNRRTVWTVPCGGFSGAHFATFPPDLIRPCVMAGCPVGGIVLDPFMGAGTTALVAAEYNRKFIGCELNPEYREIALARIKDEVNQVKLF